MLQFAQDRAKNPACFFLLLISRRNFCSPPKTSTVYCHSKIYNLFCDSCFLCELLLFDMENWMFSLWKLSLSYKTSLVSPNYWQVVRDSIVGLWIDEEFLARLIVSRAGIDLMIVIYQYQLLYKSNLDDVVIDDTSGDYKDFMMTLLGAIVWYLQSNNKNTARIFWILIFLYWNLE